MSDPTEIVSVRCNHCGAPLQVPQDTHFFACTYCGTQLELHQSGGAVFTQTIEQIDQRTQRMEAELQELRRRQAIEDLDREWDVARQRMLSRNDDGSYRLPTPGVNVFAGVVLAGMGLIWMTLLFAFGVPC